MRKIRVLVVDDSVVVRRLVTNVLSNEPGFEVVGGAANGRICLAKLTQVNPDIITLDVEMPVMDGLETLREIRKTHPRLPVIMFSTLTHRGAEATLDALSLGASDYVTKPSSVGGVSAAVEAIRQALVPKIRSLVEAAQMRETALERTSAVTVPPPAVVRAVIRPKVEVAFPGRIDLLVIGTSTGGPNALAEVLPHLPKDFPIPILIVQHMPPLFTKLLAERLRASSQISVEEGFAGAVIEPGKAWIAPGNYHMTVEQKREKVELRTSQDPPENSCRPAVDVLFRSVVNVYGSYVLGVVMTGMGQDGLRGCERIKEAGGQVLVQNEASSVVWSMPGAVANAGLADDIFPRDALGPQIVRRVLKDAVSFAGARKETVGA
ncbi:MAG: chemotaxis response regulator protein-glutamate methylesterase [Acidobacteria bacterium]|nr:chemotaxis response regulator protein-glutamate methylesterase [Acidobacteriota bacterium]